MAQSKGNKRNRWTCFPSETMASLLYIDRVIEHPVYGYASIKQNIYLGGNAYNIVVIH